MNRIGNVSFGELRTGREGRMRVSVWQEDIEKEINTVFENRDIKDYDKYNYQGRNLDSMLEEDMGMDLYIKHLINGNTEISLRNTKNGCMENQTKRFVNDFLRKILREENNGSNQNDLNIALNIDKGLSNEEISNLIKAFADKCYDLAKRCNEAIDNRF